MAVGNDIGVRSVRVLQKQRREIVRLRILSLALAVGLVVALLLPYTGGQREVTISGPATTATESVTEVRTEARLVVQSGEPIVAPRQFTNEGVTAGDFRLTVQSTCHYRALNYDISATVENTSDELAGGRVRLIYRNIEDKWIGASEADFPVLEPGDNATVAFGQTVPCRGDMGSQTVTSLEAELL
jgi:hypothetical protein